MISMHRRTIVMRNFTTVVMSRAFVGVLAVVLSALLAIEASGQVVLSLDPILRENVREGDDLTFNLMLSGEAPDVWGFNTHIRLDTTKLRFVPTNDDPNNP